MDNYIRHLELQRNGLRGNLTRLLQKSDKNYLKKGTNPNFNKEQETRQRIKNLNNKLEFLTKLREELIKNEIQDKKNRKR